MRVDTRSEACADCHRRGSKDATINGTRSQPYLTLDYACGHCHVGYGRAWLARGAHDVHGPTFRAAPAPEDLGSLIR